LRASSSMEASSFADGGRSSVGRCDTRPGFYAIREDIGNDNGSPPSELRMWRRSSALISSENRLTLAAMAAQTRTPVTTIAFPILAIAFVILAPLVGFDGTQALSARSLTISAVMIGIMLGAIFAAVHHADVIAHRTGEPYGTLVLTLAVTVIEVALIESIVLMPNSSPALARDTVFAVIMIVCNGLVGLCILVGGLRHHEQEFQISGTGVYLIVLGALSVLTLVLPNYTLPVRISRRRSSSSSVFTRSCCTRPSCSSRPRGMSTIFGPTTTPRPTDAISIPRTRRLQRALCFSSPHCAG